jgi:hypothetical protein
MKPCPRRTRPAWALAVLACWVGGVTVLTGCGRSPQAAAPTPAVRRQVEAIAADYVTKQKKWDGKDYRVEHLGWKDSSGHWVVHVVHKDDEAAAGPGGGKSLELHIDLAGKRVSRELHFQ